MLLTTCPNCQAQFKVTPEQLNVRSGRVMCGRCRHVFNSFESLQRIDSTLGQPPAQTESAPATAGRSLLDESPAQPNSAPHATPQPAPHASPSAGPSAASFAAAAAPASYAEPEPFAPAAFTESDAEPARSPGQSAPLGSVPDEVPVFEPLPAEPLRAAHGNPPPGAPYRNAPLLPREAPQRPSAGWTVLALLAVVTLAGQAAYAYRSEIVSQYPALRPGFDKACETLGCSLPWGRDASLIKVDSSDLIEELGTRGRFLLTATFTNRAPGMQDYPHLELSLTDTGNQTLTRRVLAPEAYLGRKPTRGEGLAPGATAPVNVRIESQLPSAAGYHLEPLYP